jgi:hypothetical protein
LFQFVYGRPFEGQDGTRIDDTPMQDAGVFIEFDRRYVSVVVHSGHRPIPGGAKTIL